MIYCFDIDGTVCTQTPDNKIRAYNEAEPFVDMIEAINKLYDAGHRIIFFTARGSSSGIDWREFTEKQLTQWGFKYHELILGKPTADVFIDDKAVNVRDWGRCGN
uniref:Polynucleotide kinase n=1 Tax=viral metagenome TaxID=1070528 RepID=A0A6M3LFA5_9ZZZZ